MLCNDNFQRCLKNVRDTINKTCTSTPARGSIDPGSAGPRPGSTTRSGAEPSEPLRPRQDRAAGHVLLPERVHQDPM